MYKCERCGGTFAAFKTPGQCPLCGVWASVKCKACGHIDSANVFISNGDCCPKCHRHVAMPSARVQPPPPKKLNCPFCGVEIPDDATVCGGCGKSRSLILGALKLQSVARTLLVSGILNITVGMCISVVGIPLVIPIPMGLLVLSLGVWEIINANLFWHSPPKVAWSLKHVAILELVILLCGPVWNLIFGLINLNRLGDPNIKAYLDNLYDGNSLKPKIADRRLTGWILIVTGGIFVLTGGLILILFNAVSTVPSDRQAFVLATVFCPTPMLVVGLAMLAGGAYTLRGLRKLEKEPPEQIVKNSTV